MLILATLLPLFAPVPLGPADDPVRDLGRFGRRFTERSSPLDEEDWDTVGQWLIDLRGTASSGRKGRQEAAEVLLDLHGHGRGAALGTDLLHAADGWRLATRSGEEFAALLDTRLAEWVSREILVVEAGNTPERRGAAALLLAQRREDSVLSALLVCARSREPILRGAAIEALVGWQDEAVHHVHLGLLKGDMETTPATWLGSSEAHFRRTRLEDDSRNLADLETFVRTTLEAEDWRTASRAVDVSWGLPDEHAVPLLLAALATWSARVEAGEPVRRLQGDLARELSRRSGLDLGLKTARWVAWWAAVRAGQTQPRLGGQSEDLTRAAFFGLKPESDRVVLILDRSGSMEKAFGRRTRASGSRPNSGLTRHQEVLNQLETYLGNLSPNARFNLVVFGDDARAWRSSLQPATKSQLRAVQAWAQRQKPKGGTHLRRGVEEALGIDRNGVLDHAALQADTLVILCDGYTSDGPDWVVPFLRRIHPRARVIVHGVQIGEGGDGTLEALATGTGGEFVLVEG